MKSLLPESVFFTGTGYTKTPISSPANGSASITTSPKEYCLTGFSVEVSLRSPAKRTPGTKNQKQTTSRTSCAFTFLPPLLVPLGARHLIGRLGLYRLPHQ